MPSPPKPKARVRHSLKAVEKRDLALSRSLALPEEAAAARWTARLAELGDQPPLQLLCAATIAGGALRRDRRLFRAGLRMLAAHSLATLAKACVKDAVDRTRPGEAIAGRKYRMTTGTSRDPGLRSMPSGHSAGTVAVATAALVDYPQAAGAALAGSAVVIGAQLPSRNHYLSDIAIGGLIGLVAFGASRVLLPRLDRQAQTAFCD